MELSEIISASAAFLGWCTLINFIVLIVSTVALVFCRQWVSSIHGRLFGLEESELAKLYFQYIATYKIAVIVFNLVPYLALRIIEGRF